TSGTPHHKFMEAPVGGSRCFFKRAPSCLGVGLIRGSLVLQWPRETRGHQARSLSRQGGASLTQCG
ncbi:MAG: hypothetical protein ACK5SL_02420, partial [Cyclobacteriaceae bacterium]